MIMIILLLATLTLVDSSKTVNCRPRDHSVVWWGIGSVWFTRVNTDLTWFEHEGRCRGLEDGLATMATVRSRDEMNHLTKIISQTGGGGSSWLAGVRVFHNSWRWYKQVYPKEILTKMTFTNWRSGEPDGYGCLLASTDGTWGAYPCTNTNYAFCEYRCEY